ncbi:MAG: dienelactone hydrolase family protein [Rhodospirillales bacterium]|nr:dienelactone hydrolase family protein [Rhodospirillales bacterium]
MSQVPSLSGPTQAPRSGGVPKQLVILVHGVGADGNDLIGLAPFYQRALPDAVFVAPNAPYRFDMAPFGYQWFSVQDLQRDTRLTGVQAAAPILDAFIDEQLIEYGLGDDRLLLVGFSQGTMMALHVGLRREAAPAGIVAHSGMLVGEHLLSSEIRTRPPVLLTHGALDEVLPVQALPLAEAALNGAGVPVESHIMPGLGHGIDEATIALDLAFMTRIFPPAGDGLTAIHR